MILYRCSLKRWAGDLSGKGAYQYGGRWNSPGQHAVYTAENNLLAALEVALRIPLNKISSDYLMTPVVVPDHVDVYVPRLPKGWQANQVLTRHRGDNFLSEKKFLLMKVPSALMSHAYNFILNPNHEDMGLVKAGKSQSLVFDKRLIELMRRS